MLRSMFAGVAGLRGHQTMMDTVGNNISNVNTTGYKASRTTFEESMVQTMRGATAPGDAQGGVNPYQLGLGSRVAGTDTVFSQGALQDTGRRTDVAINGEGLFAVEADGETFYTRHGAFDVDAEGNVVDSSGRFLLGTDADPINLYDGVDADELRSFDIGADGTITGRMADGTTAELGQVGLATFPNPEGLERVGESLFAETPNSGAPGAMVVPGEGDAGSLVAGALEGSNVDLAQEFTNLIIAQRGFQANSRGITTSDEMLQELVQMKR